ncbi:hypothetical protein BKA65DRAFT_471495 [Rhexocercosporidium sp. MPI-PUGE-AT-0058]|nr:hypothetical protein BKA65DRAFT_471495 [Rhexocercosporidium sp. MPI-PUGE-AT-0058]
MCIDGNRIKIPPILESPPQPHQNTPPFVLDILHEAATKAIQVGQETVHNIDGYSFDALELLLSRRDVAMSEFELIKLTYRWCKKNNVTLLDFLHLFDVNLLTSKEKAWTLSQLPPSTEAPT